MDGNCRKTWMLLGLSAVLAWRTALPQGSAHTDSAAGSRERLPATVRPLNYDLRIHPDADKLIFTGEVDIAVQVDAKVDAVVLNAKDLVFDEVRLDGAGHATVSLDQALERASLRFPDGVSAGRHTLSIRYHGAIARGTLGFFAMDYVSAAGPRRTLATNFEPASERSFLPSWDEPARKAEFRVTVDAPADRMAISNMPVQSESPLPNGMKRVRFARSPAMSTYLLFLAIGDYERITREVDGVQVGVVVSRGDAHKGEYALGEAAGLLHYYNRYFGVRFPLPKLDLVAAPGKIEGGSMENWGSIFFSQDHLLFDPAGSTESDRQLVFLVVSHEMAHQWFGDLVTMSWWNNLWLNEGFARWMQTKAADDLHPQWKTGLQASSIIEQGMRADAKPSTHAIEQAVASAAEAETAFDEITYDKGAAVIGMLENYVGADQFRDGVRLYMHDHAYGNTVSADLWRALQSVTGKAVPRVATDFTRRPGLPLVTVRSEQAQAGNVRVELTQSRFFEAHDSNAAEPTAEPWELPLSVKSVSGATSTAMLLNAERGEVACSGPTPAVANAGRKSYARVRYAAAVFGDLAARFGALTAADQIAMLQDAWALGQSDYAPVTDVLRLIEATPTAADPIVWSKAINILVTVDRLYAGLPGRSAYRAWARARLAPLVSLAGWSPSPGEDPQITLLRQPLLMALSRFGDPAVIAEGRRLYASTAADKAAQSPEIRRIARQIVASTADTAAFDRLLEDLRAAQDPLEKQHLLEDLTGVADPALARRVLDLAIGSDAPAGSMPTMLARLSRDHPDETWNFAVSHVDAPGFQLDRSTRMRLLPIIPSNSTDLRRVDELRAYAAAHLPAAAARDVSSAIAQIQLAVRFRARAPAEIDQWLLADR